MLQKTQTIKKPLTRSVTVRFSHELFNHYENESKKLGVKFSELIRQKLQKKTKQST